MFLFSKRSDFLVILIPIVFILFSGWELITDAHLSFYQKNIFYFISGIVCLNTIHIFFTFYLICLTPEYRQILFTTWGKHSQRILVFLVAFFFVATLVVTLFSNRMTELAVICISIFGLYHAIKQSLGLSLIYNNRIRKEVKSRKILNQIDRGEIIERKIFKVIVFLSSAGFLIRLLTDDMPVQLFFLRIGLGFALMATLFLILTYLKVSRSIFWVKSLFLIRLITFPLLHVSFFGGIGVTALHGIEYFFIFKRIRTHLKARSISMNLIRHPVLYLFLGGVIAGALALPDKGALSLVYMNLDYDSLFFKLVLIFIGTVTLSHYFLDGILFQMKREDIRRLTGAWLVADCDR